MTQQRVISRCDIKPTKNDPDGYGTLAYVSILVNADFDSRLGGGVWIHDWEIYRSRTSDRLYVSAPRRYDEYGNRWRTITFADKGVQDRFEDFVLSEYRRYMEELHS